MAGMLEQLLRQSQPGVNPELEQMISKLMMGAQGSEPAQGSPAAAMRQPLPQSALGTGVQPSAGAPQPGPAGPQGGDPSQGIQPEAANRTYQVLVQQGVPPQLAKQAIQNPALLRDILRQLQGGEGPQEQPQMVDSGNNRMSPPALANGARPY